MLGQDSQVCFCVECGAEDESAAEASAAISALRTLSSGVSAPIGLLLEESNGWPHDGFRCEQKWWWHVSPEESSMTALRHGLVMYGGSV
eukprot:952039-Amphidinium_carterae.1